ncbi:Gamma-glutamyltranspeptidase @ Glutathione hydrolase, partial [hydrothermal vent metagenome]
MLKILFVFLFSLTLLACDGSGSSEPQHAVASAHPIATQAGIDILNQGGNAFDAAVAVSATLAVVEPYSSGMGGGGFWLLHSAKNNVDVMIDGREVAPQKAHRDMYLDKSGNVIPMLSITGPLSAGIPGQPAALVKINKEYGNLPLKEVLAPAIKAAQQGFKVSKHYQTMARFRLEALQASPAAAEIFLQDNKVPTIGYTVKQSDLANTLIAIAEQGMPGFYQGKVAQALVNGTQAAGGIWTLKDLAEYKVAVRQPLVGQFGKFKVTSVAPPSSGGVALITMLNILEERKWFTKNLADRKHLIIESMRRAYRDRAMFLGDSDFVSIPITRLTSKTYAKQLAAEIDMSMATPSNMLPGLDVEAKGNHTTHFSIIDKQGNWVAATLSVNYPFGSCFVPPGTGILLNDEMDDFSAKPGKPNAYGLVGAKANEIQPGKRMLSSMSPTFIESDDKLAILGTPGGSRIITMVLHSILNIADGKTATEVVAAPRFHHQYLPDEVQYENGSFSAEEANVLVSRGHRLKNLKSAYGNMQVIIVDKTKKSITAASDPRGEGMS